MHVAISTHLFEKTISPKSIIPIMLLFLSIIALNNHFKEEFKEIKDYNKTLEKCHDTVGVAILNTSITIVFGFSILILSNFIPTIYFGIFTGLAMMLAMLLVLTLLPCFLISFKPFGNTN